MDHCDSVSKSLMRDICPSQFHWILIIRHLNLTKWHHTCQCIQTHFQKPPRTWNRQHQEKNPFNIVEMGNISTNISRLRPSCFHQVHTGMINISSNGPLLFCMATLMLCNTVLHTWRPGPMGVITPQKFLFLSSPNIINTWFFSCFVSKKCANE